jgi:hypothetical protein
MKPSRGMGVIAPGKIPRAKRRGDSQPVIGTGKPIKTFSKGGDTSMAKNWISGAIKKPGALRSSLGVKKGEKIPAKKLETAAKAPGKMGQRARLAQTLRGFKK